MAERAELQYFLKNGRELETALFQEEYADLQPSCYEVIRVIGGKALFLEAHYRRFVGTVESIGQKIPCTKQELAEALSSREDGLLITIGQENAEDDFKDLSLITATYHVDGKMVGRLGVIGPTRMKYSQVTSVIEYLTDNLNNAFTLTDGQGGNNEDNNE